MKSGKRNVNIRSSRRRYFGAADGRIHLSPTTHDALMIETTLIEKQQSLAEHFKPGFLQRPETVFQFRFDVGEAFYLCVFAETFKFVSGVNPLPTVTLFLPDHATCWGLLEGKRDGMKAFLQGDYRADGNIVLSQLILYLFKPNDPTLIYEVQD